MEIILKLVTYAAGVVFVPRLLLCPLVRSKTALGGEVTPGSLLAKQAPSPEDFHGAVRPPYLHGPEPSVISCSRGG